MCSEKPICVPLRLLEVSTTLPLKRFQCSSDRRLPSLVLSKNSVKRFLFSPLSPPGDRWYILVFVPAGSVSNSSILQTFHDTSQVALPASLSARSFPFTPACPGQYTVFEGGCQPLTHSSLGLPFHFSLSLFFPRAHRVHIKGRNNAVSR